MRIFAFQAFKNLLTNPMIPKLKPGFWGQPEFWQETWQKSGGRGSSSAAGGSSAGGSTSSSSSGGGGTRKLSTSSSFEEFEFLAEKTIANYSAFRGFRIYACVDEDTCLGTASEYLENSGNRCAENRDPKSIACSDCVPSML